MQRVVAGTGFSVVSFPFSEVCPQAPTD